MIATTDTIQIDVNMEHDMAYEFEKQADEMHLFADEYCGLVLTTWIESGRSI